MNMFEEIDKYKKDLPKFKALGKKIKKYKYNFYQLFAIFIFVFSIFLGIVLGSLFSICGTSSAFYSGICLTKKFNYILMFAIWLCGFAFSVFFFAIGHIVSLLINISNKLENKEK